MHAEVESLIARAESSPSFLETPAIGKVSVSLVGRQLGAYRIESSIGAGAIPRRADSEDLLHLVDPVVVGRDRFCFSTIAATSASSFFAS